MNTTQSQDQEQAASAARTEIVCPKCGERHNVTNMTGATGEPGLYHCHTCGEQWAVD